jgi:hypothetical protein
MAASRSAGGRLSQYARSSGSSAKEPAEKTVRSIDQGFMAVAKDYLSMPPESQGFAESS